MRTKTKTNVRPDQDLRAVSAELQRAALAAVEPGAAVCRHVRREGDALVVAPDSAGTSLTTTDSPALSAQCYFAGITRFINGCGSRDLYVLRYLCYTPEKGWHYINYAYCL